MKNSIEEELINLYVELKREENVTYQLFKID
jgi:hypothetical protein